MKLSAIFIALGLASAHRLHAASVSFEPKEQFRLSFGKGRETLGAKIEGGNFIFPRDFTIDVAGHVYVYDTNNHRIARFSPEGQYQIGYQYPETARQVFAHADTRQNLWLLVSDPLRGLYYGVYDSRGKTLKSGIFAQYNQFRLHLDDDAVLHIILSSDKKPGAERTYILEEESLLMKKEQVAAPPENHHRVKKNEKIFFVDRVPDGSKEDAHHVNRVTDEAHRNVADIKGTVIYVTDRGELYTRVGEREIRVYDVGGALLGKVLLTGLSSACASIRFDSDGNLYELDGIPDEKGQYTAEMPGMRFIRWQRQ